MHIVVRIREFYNDPEYFPNIRKIAIPIIIQQFTFAGLNMLGVVMVGQKSETSVAAVGFAGQIAFLLQLVHVPNLRRVLGLCLLIAVSASLIFFALSQLLPAEILSIYTKDAEVIRLGAEYHAEWNVSPF